MARLVRQAKQENEVAKLAVHEKFRFFLKKYQQLLTNGQINLDYTDIRGFISLYTTSRLRGLVLSGKLNEKSKAAVYNKVNELRGQYASLGRDDIDSIINLTFFQCLNVYDEKGKVKKELKKHGIDYDILSDEQKDLYDKKYPPVGFEGFLINYYKYLLRKNLDKEARGLVPGIGWVQTLNDDVDIDWVSEENSDVVHDIEHALGNEVVIDEEWVRGVRVAWPFDTLSQQERWLLKMRYGDKLFAIDIGNEIGLSPAVVRTRINRVKDKLKTEIERNGKYYIN